MKLRDLLEMKEFKYRTVITIEPNETISTAVNKMVEYDMGSLPVCNKKGELVGIITERDIARNCATNDSCANINIQDAMSEEVSIGTPEDDLDYVISIMKQKRIRHLPVVENGTVVGIISMRDLLLLYMVHV